MGIITTADHLYRALDLAAWPTRLPATHAPGTPTPAVILRARQQCLELTGSDGTHTSRAGARALDVSTGPSTHGHERRWAHPGKRSPGHSATTGHASEADRLFVFSTSAAPFQPGRPYSPFQAYALLHHGGDYRAAAADLRARGFGGGPAAGGGEPWGRD